LPPTTLPLVSVVQPITGGDFTTFQPRLNATLLTPPSSDPTAAALPWPLDEPPERIGLS
jgi:hypothetical protein